MYNQCIVLLVSYFSSTVEDIFKEAFYARLKSGNPGNLESEEFKITVGQLLYGNISDVFVQKNSDINFQNMRSTLRSFEKYIELPEIEQDRAVHNIILAQIMRHCIVHSGCIITNQAIGRLKGADKRTIMPASCIVENKRIWFSEEDVRQIKEDMLSFVELILNNTSKAFSK